MKYETANFRDLHVDEMRQKIEKINKVMGKYAFVPTSSLGFELQKLREKSIEDGTKLFSEDEVLEEIARRRSGLVNVSI